MFRPATAPKLISDRLAPLLIGVLCALPVTGQEPGPDPKPGLAPVAKRQAKARRVGLAKELRLFQRTMVKLADQMRSSVVRLEIHRALVQGSTSKGRVRVYRMSPVADATGVVIHPGVVVTTQEALFRAQMVIGFAKDTQGAVVPFRLRVLGSFGDVAVLTGYYGPLPPSLRPVRKGATRKLPHGSLAFLVDGGTEALPGVALPGALLKLSYTPPVRKGAVPVPRELLGLKGVSMTSPDRGALVCDLNMAMLGLARPGPTPRWVVQDLHREPAPARGGGGGAGGRKPGPKSGGSGGGAKKKKGGRQNLRITFQNVRTYLARAKIDTVIPVEKVMAAVDRVLAAKPAPSPSKPTLGIQCGQPLSTGHPRVDRVYFASPAHRAGMKVGDLITHWNGQPVTGLKGLETLILKDLGRRPECKVTIERAGRPVQLVIVLGK